MNTLKRLAELGKYGELDGEVVPVHLVKLSGRPRIERRLEEKKFVLGITGLPSFGRDAAGQLVRTTPLKIAEAVALSSLGELEEQVRAAAAKALGRTSPLPFDR